MNTDNPVFQLSDPSDTLSAVEERVRGIVTAHGIEPAADTLYYTVREPAPDLPGDLRFALHDVLSTSNPIGVETALETALRSPVQRLKRAFHQLVIFYVNKAIGQQVGFNTAAARALNLLATRIAANEIEIAVLRHELETLRAELDRAHQE